MNNMELNEEELLKRLSNPEDNFTERKPEGVNRSEIRKTVVAFANSVPEKQTGVLFIGAYNDGTIQGVSNSDSLQKTIRDICENDCYPSITFSSRVLKKEGKLVIAVVVPPSNNRPHFSGPAYVRLGSESIVASEKLFNELVTSRLNKPREILKWKGKSVTVILRDEKSCITKSLGDSIAGCRIDDCNSYYIRFFDILTSTHISEPLENIMLAWDESRDRLKLIILKK
jgi:Schlafen, AlbA_2